MKKHIDLIITFSFIILLVAVMVIAGKLLQSELAKVIIDSGSTLAGTTIGYVFGSRKRN